MTFDTYRDALLRIALEQGCSDAEVFAQESTDFSVEVMEQQIDSYSVSRSLGLSVRVCLEGKNGYAYTELLEEPEALVERAIENCKVNGASFLSLEVRRSNTAAIGLYTAFDFEIEGTRKKYYSDPEEDALIMTCHFEQAKMWTPFGDAEFGFLD